jgi:hypothetical protein
MNLYFPTVANRYRLQSEYPVHSDRRKETTRGGLHTVTPAYARTRCILRADWTRLGTELGFLALVHAQP